MMRACLGIGGHTCGVLINAGQSRCPRCKGVYQRNRDARRGTPAERGYNATYRALRRRILAAGGSCVWCGGIATTADHLIPLARGGQNELDNLVPSCKRCNYRRGGQMARR